MRRRLVVVLWLGLMGCSRPSTEACRAACLHVVDLTTAAVEGISPERRATLRAQASERLGPCVDTCRHASASYVACLREATTLRQVDECRELD